VRLNPQQREGRKAELRRVVRCAEREGRKAELRRVVRCAEREGRKAELRRVVRCAEREEGAGCGNGTKGVWVPFTPHTQVVRLR
jgi:glycine/D-amino acid oxidase-like deaminating enzyme